MDGAPLHEGILDGLAAGLINFLTGKAVTARLRDTSFIGCAGLGGPNLTGDCSTR